MVFVFCFYEIVFSLVFRGFVPIKQLSPVIGCIFSTICCPPRDHPLLFTLHSTQRQKSIKNVRVVFKFNLQAITVFTTSSLELPYPSARGFSGQSTVFETNCEEKVFFLKFQRKFNIFSLPDPSNPLNVRFVYSNTVIP